MVESIIYKQALLRGLDGLSLPDGNILITGASGLIGSCLIDMLMLANSKGHNYNLYALGRNKRKLIERFKSYEGNPFLHFIEQDICSPLDVSIVFDYIVHGASNADPRKYALFPVETMITNLQGTYNILSYCKEHKKTKLILLSTFEVYGNRGFDEYTEDQFGIIDVNSVRSSYPESKRSAEIMTRSFVEEYGIYAMIARLCSIYGPSMATDDSKAHAQFLRKALNKNDIILKSKGNQRRSYCYVIDAVTGILCILAKGVNSEVYNIANENSIATIAEVANTIAKIVGVDVVYDLPSDIEIRGFSNPQNCILNNERLITLGWKGHYSLIDGLEETMAVLKELSFK